MPTKKTTSPKKQSAIKQQTISSSNEKKTNTISIFAIILTFLLFTIPIVGLALGIIALVQINKRKEGGKGLAIASIVISSIFIVLQIIFWIFIVSLASLGDGITNGRRSFTFNKDGNSVSLGGNVSLPSGFPSDVPIYPDSKIKLSTKSDKGDYSVTLTTQDGQSKVADYYKNEMVSKGWTSGDEQALGEIGQMNAVGTYTKGDLKTTLVVLQGQNSPTTTVFITVNKSSQQ